MVLYFPLHIMMNFLLYETNTYKLMASSKFGDCTVCTNHLVACFPLSMQMKRAHSKKKSFFCGTTDLESFREHAFKCFIYFNFHLHCMYKYIVNYSLKVFSFFKRICYNNCIYVLLETKTYF